MTVGSLALIGFTFLAGFYLKDLILEVAFAKFTNFSHYLGTLSAFLTFLSNPNGYKPVIENAFDSSLKISFVLSVLVIPSIFIGFLLKTCLCWLG